MPKTRKAQELNELRSRFKTALAEAGLSTTQWARDHNWSHTHVSLALTDPHRASSHLVLAAVREFVAEWEPRIAQRLATQPALAAAV